MNREKPTFDIPGKWTHWPPLPEDLECDECEKPFEVGSDVWILEADSGGIPHLCLDCAERFIYRIQREQPEALPTVASKLTMVLYRPERDLTLGEIAAIEAATTILQESGRVLLEHSPTVH